MDLNQFTDQDLKDELQRREVARKSQEEMDREARFRLLVEHRDVLLKFVPHSRTSCSDEDPNNGLGSADYGARCERCALLTLDMTDYISHDVQFGLHVTTVD